MDRLPTFAGDNFRPESGPTASSWYDFSAIVVCVVTGILALALGHLHQVGNWGAETDFYGAYAPQALNILSGKPYTYPHYPPGYMIVLAGTSFVTHDLFTAAKIISALATACFGWLSYVLVRALFDRRLAFVSMLFVLLALLPHSFLAATDMLANLCLVLPLWIFLRGKATATVCLQAGLAAGLAYLIRYNAVFVLAGIPMALMFINPDHESLKHRIVKSSVYLSSAFVVMLPWLIANWWMNGSPFASDLHRDIALHFYHPQSEGLGGNIETEMGTRFNWIGEVLSYDPVKVLRKFVKDVLYNHVLKLTVNVIQFPAFLFVGAGLLLSLRQPTRRYLTFLVVCGFGYCLHGLGPQAERFYFFLFPLFFLWVAVVPFFGDEASSPFRAHILNKRLLLGWVVVGVLLFDSAYTSYGITSRLLNSDPKHLLELAEVLKVRSSPNDVIMAIKPHIGYLTNLKVVSAAVADSGDLYDQKMREQKVRYIVYSSHEAKYWEGLKALSDPAHVPKSFRLIYEHGPTDTLVYEIQKSSDGH